MSQSEPNVIVFLVGNKSDMAEKREVSQERVEQFKREKGIMFSFETSAKTGENIEEVFVTASKILFTQFKDKIAEMKEEAIKKRKDKKARQQERAAGAQGGTTLRGLQGGEEKKKGKCCK
mmetsp:Transcript_11085/g.16866  ORF Transcript_11085/g.16866 Transcript_11085/m.16866 type:complete len:120 (-) Transcript_11085:21-380(-)